MTQLNRLSYQKLIDENMQWLMKQPRTLERDHIALILTQEVDREMELRAFREKAKPVCEREVGDGTCKRCRKYDSAYAGYCSSCAGDMDL